MLRIINVRVSVTSKATPKELAMKKLRCKEQEIEKVMVVRRAIDARRKPELVFVYTLQVEVRNEQAIWKRCQKDKNISQMKLEPVAPIIHGEQSMKGRPVVVGFGPAGMMAAYYLAKEGYAPIVLERGYDVDTRSAHVAEFWEMGKFRPESNVQFGEGGAGTFSDGKLTTRVNHPRLMEISQILVDAGAPEEILYLHKPHVGTDILRDVVKRIRERICSLGGEVRFQSCVTDIKIEEGMVQCVTVNGTDTIETNQVLLCIGHSARDTYEMLYEKGVAMEAKPFAIGVRIEHEQSLINESQYGCEVEEFGLGAADYSLVYHSPNGRTAYSFCMCPGGTVIGGSSEPEGVVTNGMSLHARDSGVANSALVVNVSPEDVGPHPLDGIAFQRKYERLAYEAGGRTYKAPAQYVGQFLKTSEGQEVGEGLFSYKPGVVMTDLHTVLPDFVSKTLEEAIPYFGRRIHNFDHPMACLTGVETRTSAPLRILRNKQRISTNTIGLYPVGEGAGYAGGIMSAALDGAETAIAVMEAFGPARKREEL